MTWTSESSLRLFNRQWLSKQPESARRGTRDLALILATQVIIGIAALTASADRPSYYKAHGALFIISVLAVLAFFACKSTVADMILAYSRVG